MEEKIYIIIISITVFICALIPTLLTLWLNERVKNSVKSTFDKKLEEVKFENAKKLSDFQSEIDILKSKENIKFAKLHEKRFEVLAETYKHINNILVALHNSVIPTKQAETNVSFEESEKKLFNTYRVVIFNFYEYFAINRIYLNVTMADLIDNFAMQANAIASENAVEKGQGGMRVYSKLNDIVMPIKKDIEIEFRKVLGE